jgi:FkbM family methyltransferase
MTFQIPGRFQILRHWLARKARGAPLAVSDAEMMQFLFSPPRKQRAARWIESVDTDGEHLRVKIKSVAHPLFWPAKLGLQELQWLVCQVMDPEDWHYYQVPGMVVAKDDVVVDCGGGEGLFSLVVSQVCRKVYVVEPHPMLIKALRRTFEKIPNVEVVECLLTDAAGPGHLLDEGTCSQGTGGPGLSVRFETLDSVFHDAGIAVSYIKADVEGAEMLMLAGGRRTIQACAPRIAITTYHRVEHADTIAQFLTQTNPRYQIQLRGLTDNEPRVTHDASRITNDPSRITSRASPIIPPCP